MPNPIPRYLSFGDILVFLDGFKNQYTYLSFSDTLTFTDGFTQNYHDFTLTDHLYFNEKWQVKPSHYTLSDTLQFTQSFYNVTNESFTDTLHLTEIWSTTAWVDTIAFIDGFTVVNATTFGDQLIFDEEFILSGKRTQVMNDKLNLYDSFAMIKVPKGTVCD